MRSCIFYKCLVGDTQFHALSADGEKFPQRERVVCIPNIVQVGVILIENNHDTSKI